MDNLSPMTDTDLLASASSILESGRYKRVQDARIEQRPAPNYRVFEDDYHLVALVVYDTWQKLISNWMDAQTALVDLMSNYMTSSDPKAWDGYLVLLTTGVPGLESSEKVDEIRYDTTRVRKIVGTGEDITTIGDVKRVLQSLLPLEPELHLAARESALGILPSLLAQRGLQEKFVEAVVNAFCERQPIVERLHSVRRENET